MLKEEYMGFNVKKQALFFFMIWSWCLLFAQEAALSEQERGAAEQGKYQSSDIKPNKMDKNKWEKLKKDLKIDEPKPEKPKEQKLDKAKDVKKEDKKLNINPALLQVLKWSSFILLTGLLLFFVLKILGINPFAKTSDKNNLQFSIEELEDNLDKVQIDPYIAEALKNNDYRLAIRLYYLMIIQKLALNEKIVWKKYKTNKHYLNEMRSRDTFTDFRLLTTDYERIWFSNMMFDKKDYDHFQPKFVQYLHSIR